MTRVSVRSDAMSSAGYDVATAVLEIEFRGGAVYRYFAVPPHHYTGLLAAESKGRYFNTHVRSEFRFERIT